MIVFHIYTLIALWSFHADIIVCWKIVGKFENA